MKHTPHTAALAARAILERTSRLPKTLADFLEWQAHSESLPPSRRPDDPTWANSYQAYRLAAEQLCGQRPVPDDLQQQLALAIQEVMPELFADHWEAKL